MPRGKKQGRPTKAKASGDQTKADEEKTTGRTTENTADNDAVVEEPKQEKTKEGNGKEHAHEQPPAENAEDKEVKAASGKRNEQLPTDKAEDKEVKLTRGKKGNNSKKAKETSEEDKTVGELKQEAVGEVNRKEDRGTGNRNAKDGSLENENEASEAKPSRPRRRAGGKDSAMAGEGGGRGNVVQQYQDLGQAEGAKGRKKQQQKRHEEKETEPEKQVGDGAFEGNVAGATSKESGKTMDQNKDASSQSEDLTGFSCTDHLLNKEAKVLEFKLTRGRNVKVLAVEEAKKLAMSTCFDYMVQKMLE